MQASASGWLKVVIDKRSVKFGKRLIDSQPQCFRYIGTLTHSDFAFPLCQIEAEDDRVLDELYDKNKIIISGCEPDSEYGGFAQFIASPAGQRRIH